ncbi:MAG: FG-GAP repeat protein [Deltaproteobacteria bacterium]|nr:FG-GAP repeat protein [Deltaproteobacteria bacterium]
MLLLLVASACAPWRVTLPGEDDTGQADLSRWYADVDGDGYGDPDAPLDASDPPAGYVAQAGDCDDGDAAVHPGALESCDGVDNDCDGLTDPEHADGCTWFYADLDADGYGDSSSSACLCAQNGIFTTTDGNDCDDGAASVHPDAEEICDDAIDQDCDGLAPACRHRGTFGLDHSDIVRITGEAAGDFAGRSVSAAGDVNGDGFDDILVGAWKSSAGGTCSGAVYLVHGPILDDRNLVQADARFLGEEVANFAGYSVSGADDTDGDGFDDILVGAWRNSASGSGAGAAYLLNGPVPSGGDLSLADARLLGEQPGDLAGYAVSRAGDVNGDGFADLLVGAPAEVGGTGTGAAYLVHGPVVGDRHLSLADARIRGETLEDLAGASVSGAGDVDGDGLDDILVGASHHDAAGFSSGAAYLLYGPVEGDRSLSLADARFVGEETGDLAGYAVSGAGDVDGDGHADLLVGAPQANAGSIDSGAAYLISTPLEGDWSLSLASVRLAGEASRDLAGLSVAGAGDVDADGFDDILVGAAGYDLCCSDAGAAYLLYGPVTNSLSLSLSDARFVGVEIYDNAGDGVSGAGDVNADGFADFLVGAVGDDAGGSDAGAAYLILFPSNPGIHRRNPS